MSLQTQNRLQDIFNSIEFNLYELFSIADTKTKRKVNIYIEELKDKGLLNGYFGILANNIYNRTRAKNSEILELLIYGAYIEEQAKLNEKELAIFKEDANYYYQEGQKEVNKALNKKEKESVIPETIFLSLLALPNSKGYVYDDYKEAIIKYNADQIYRQAIIDIQQQKPLEIENDVYQGIIKRQQNQKLNINGDKISGDIDLTLIGINNKAKVEGIYSFDKNAKVRFIAVEDKATTKMCKSLDNMIFNVNDWNSFYRYSDYDKKDVFYKVKGLVTGVNLPPINNHFHWCRSTLQYISNVENNLKKEYNVLKIPDLINKLIIKQKQTIHERAKKFIDKNTNENDYIFDNNYRSFMSYNIEKDKIIINPVHNDAEYYIIDESVAHEVVHLKDIRNGIIDNNYSKLSTLFNNSKIYLKSNMPYYGSLVANNPENSSLCDIINILTDGRISIGAFAHSPQYLSDTTICLRELSANIISSDLADNSIVNELIEQVSPLKKFKKEIMELWDVSK